MEDINEHLDDSLDNEVDDKLKFSCPNCGEINREDVMFLCNTCREEQLVKMDGVYMCPSCLVPGENFECLNCGSLDVTMSVVE